MILESIYMYNKYFFIFYIVGNGHVPFLYVCSDVDDFTHVELFCKKIYFLIIKRLQPF